MSSIKIVQNLNYKEKQVRDVSGNTLRKPSAEYFIVKVAGKYIEHCPL